MAKILITSITLLLSLALNAQTALYPRLNINLLSHISPEKDPPYMLYGQQRYSGCWGWYQQTKNREYAIIGSIGKTYFIDVTIPTAPVICDSADWGYSANVHNEMKTYQHYCYNINDEGGGGLKIIDMQYLPDSIHEVKTDTAILNRSHTLFIDNDKLYFGSLKKDYSVSSVISRLSVWSLADPTSPTLIRKIEQDINSSIIDHVHDMFVRNDTIYASCGGKGLHILKLTSANTFSLIQSFTNYQHSGYNHSSWLTSNGKTLVMADEVPSGLPLKILNVSDFDNIQVLATVNSHSLATPHNPYIVGNKWCWSSNYQDGLRLIDISNPAIPTEYGYFDTHPQHGVNDNFSTGTYQGNWGAYPYLPSKIILTLDMENGLFILEGDSYYKNSVQVTSINENKKTTSLFSVYPNPANETLNVKLSILNEPTELTISNTLGDIIIKQTVSIQNLTFNIQNLSSGLYFVTLSNKNFSETQKIIIQ